MKKLHLLLLTAITLVAVTVPSISFGQQLNLQKDSFKLKIIPNPVIYEMTVESEIAISPKASFKIINPQGREVVTGLYGDGKFLFDNSDVKALVPGVYFVVIIDTNGTRFKGEGFLKSW